MKRNVAVIAALALLSSLPGPVVAQDAAKPKSDSLVPIPGTGTAEVKGARLIGADVIDSANDRLGNVDEVLVTTDGRVRAVVVATGGVLGLGERKVVLPWERLRFSSQGRDLVVRTDMSRATLEAMPEYRDPSRASSDQLDHPPADQSHTGRESAPLPGPLDPSRPIRPVPPTK